MSSKRQRITPFTTAMKDGADNNNRESALIFGASNLQGQCVIEGMLKSGHYSPVFGATRDALSKAKPSFDNGAALLHVDLNDEKSIENSLRTTCATAIYLVTTTGFSSTSHGFQEAETKEFQSITNFFDVLVKVYREDGVPRHVIFSTLDDVELTNSSLDPSDSKYIQPLGDGSIVPHYSGKARAGTYGLEVLEDVDGLSLTLLTLPFLHSNFFGFAIPLPDERKAEWTISACFDDKPIDMLSEYDLSYIVPALFQERNIYKNQNIRVSAEKITMATVASIFSDIFGKDVIYNPLTPKEMASLPIPYAGPVAQMCQFLSQNSSPHHVDVTEAVMYPRKPQLFQDWLLTNSDNEAFEKVGLSVDGQEILVVAVFGATGMQGRSVIKGLLSDHRKSYNIHAITRDSKTEKAQSLLSLDSNRITLKEADFDNTQSCVNAVNGVDGVFLVTDFYGGAGMDPKVEECHAKNVIDACASTKSVKHLIFSTLESVEEMNKRLNLGFKTEKEVEPVDDDDEGYIVPEFDAKARAAVYARSKRISCTYVLMPYYTETIFNMIKPDKVIDAKTGEEKFVMTVPMDDHTKVMCMSVDDLGPAVASIFDSYQIYAGHEIGLVTDFVTVKEAADILSDAGLSKEKKGHDDDQQQQPQKEEEHIKIEQKEVPMETFLLEAKGTYIKDLGQMFRYLSKTDAVKRRRSIAQTLNLVPNAKPLRAWVEANKDNDEFRQMLGIR